jgi:hypothetical protein
MHAWSFSGLAFSVDELKAVGKVRKNKADKITEVRHTERYKPLAASPNQWMMPLKCKGTSKV